MTADAFVLVHGGFHDSRCWERLIPLLSRPALAVDLPGRGTRPAKMEDVTLEACVRSVIADIERAGLSRVVLVGHSMGGGTVPVVAARIPERIAHLVLLSTLVAPEGGPRRRLRSGDPRGRDPTARDRRRGAHRALRGAPPRAPLQRHERRGRRVVPRAGRPRLAPPLHRPGPRAGLPETLPRTYIRLRRDRSVTWEQQAHAISLLPGLAVREIDAPHQAMVTHPREVAAILNEIAESSGRR